MSYNIPKYIINENSKKKSYWIVFFHSHDSSLCNSSIKILHSSALRSQRILSNFLILWLCMTHTNQYILVKLTYSSTILMFYRIYRVPAFFVFLDVSSLCQQYIFLFELFSLIFLPIYNTYHSIQKLLNMFYK